MTFQIGEKSIIINDLLIHYYCSKKNQQTIIFLHGWRSEAKIWLEFFFQFSNFSLFALDLPGFGKSETPKKPYNLNDYATVVSQFISKLNIKNPIIISHSFGGNTALKLAINNPQLFKSLILVASSGVRPQTPKKKLSKIIAKIIKPIFSLTFMQPLKKLIYIKLRNEDYLATPQLQKTYLNIIQEDITPLLKNIQTPTLIIWGENDQETPINQAHTLHKNISQSKLIILKNAGHFSFLDQKETFIKHVTNFLNK